MIDQREMWNQKHADGEHAEFRTAASPFVRLVEPFIPSQSKILELGCGVGGDAYYLAEQGHQVLATDFSETVLGQDREQLHHPNLEFSTLDISQPLPYADKSIGTVYAHLSLHYYDHSTTQNIINEIARILPPRGILAFACKSTNDQDYGNGQELEPDFFASPKGHLRHFFTTNYIQELLKSTFEIKLLDEVEEHYVNKSAAFVRCIAEKL